MISITCTNCQAALSIDDAFAGGVCRCQHCGTIQTVPSKKKNGLSGTAAGLGVKTSKTLYQKRPREAGVGTGLDELAEAVTSSGLTGSGLSARASRPPGSAPRTGAAAAKNNMTMLVGIAAIVIIAVLVTMLVMTRGRDPGGTSTANRTGGASQTGPQSPGAPANAGEPSFAGVKLDHPSVIYVLDRGSSISEPFGSLKQAALKSIESLGPERRFQILFWDNAQDPGTFPPLLAYATGANIANVRRQTEDVYAFGATDAAPALTKAISQRPAAIVLVTAKGADLDDTFVDMVKGAKKDVPVAIHTFAVGGSGQSTALKTVAAMTGGEYRELTSAELSRFGN
ncbi:MAG: hypothetical protein WBD40_01275 [Tepidisphaeraceae bacterium]